MDRSPLIEFIKSDSFPKIVTGVGIALGVIVVFEAGVFVGRHEAMISSHWADNYGRNFGPQNMVDVDARQPGGNGTFGKIVEIASSTITIADPRTQEQRIVITDDTIIRNKEKTVSLSTLTLGASVIVLGEQNTAGQIVAKLVRVVPAPYMLSTSTAPEAP